MTKCRNYGVELLNQMNVVFGKKLGSRDVTRQCQGRVSQKRVWVVFGRAQCSRT